MVFSLAILFFDVLIIIKIKKTESLPSLVECFLLLWGFGIIRDWIIGR